MEDTTPKTSGLREEITQLKQISVEINKKLDKLLQLFDTQQVVSKQIAQQNDLKETVYNRFSY